MANLPSTKPPIPVANLPSVSLIYLQCCWYQWKICHRCSWYRWCSLTCEYLHELKEKIWNDPSVIFRGLEEDDSRKNMKQKISWHCPSNSQDSHSGDAARLGVGTAGIGRPWRAAFTGITLSSRGRFAEISPLSVSASTAVLLDIKQRSGCGRYRHKKIKLIIT